MHKKPLDNLKSSDRRHKLNISTLFSHCSELGVVTEVTFSAENV